jgi:hypothetical protein
MECFAPVIGGESRLSSHQDFTKSGDEVRGCSTNRAQLAQMVNDTRRANRVNSTSPTDNGAITGR